MTQDEIIRMAREAGCRVEHIGNAFLNNDGNLYALSELELERFAALVAEATKEKAAKVCKDYAEKCVEAEAFEAEDVALYLDAAIRSMK